MGKFADHASEVADFRHYGVPLPELAVPLAGTIEIVGGFCVVIGFLDPARGGARRAQPLVAPAHRGHRPTAGPSTSWSVPP